MGKTILYSRGRYYNRPATHCHTWPQRLQGSESLPSLQPHTRKGIKFTERLMSPEADSADVQEIAQASDDECGVSDAGFWRWGWVQMLLWDREILETGG